MPIPPAQPPLARHWSLDPALVYLNHGSFGACPTGVLEAQRRYRDRMERDAVSFFCVDLWDLLDASRAAVAPLVNAEPRDLVFVPNATVAVATVLENAATGVGLGAPLAPGDELLTTTHDYPACRNNLRRAAARAGARVVEVPFPQPGPGGPTVTGEDIVSAILGGVTPRTRLAMLSQITSPSGVVLPIARLCRELSARGVATLVDGAHGPGAVETDLAAMGAVFYTANCHKWLCAPKGVALLWVRPDLRPAFRPMALSNFADAPAGTHGRERFALEFDFVGTDDRTGACALADAVRLLPEIAGTDWPGIVGRNRALALAARDLLRERLGLEKPYEDGLIGPLAMLELPRVPVAARARLASRPTRFADALQDALLDRHRIQVPVWRLGDPNSPFNGRRSIRLSAQLYNDESQYAYLADALQEELAAESRWEG